MSNRAKIISLRLTDFSIRAAIYASASDPSLLIANHERRRVEDRGLNFTFRDFRFRHGATESTTIQEHKKFCRFFAESSSRSRVSFRLLPASHTGLIPMEPRWRRGEGVEPSGERNARQAGFEDRWGHRAPSSSDAPPSLTVARLTTRARGINSSAGTRARRPPVRGFGEAGRAASKPQFAPSS